jgi:hypothetical protein
METLAQVVAIKSRPFPAEWMGRTSEQISTEMEMAKRLSEPIKQVHPSTGDVIRAVACAYGISAQTIKSAQRRMDIVHARHVSMLLCKIIFDHSYPRIARDHGKMDHSTVLHACRKLAWLIPKIKAMHTDNDPISAWAVTMAQLHPFPQRWRRYEPSGLPYTVRDIGGRFTR